MLPSRGPRIDDSVIRRDFEQSAGGFAPADIRKRSRRFPVLWIIRFGTDVDAQFGRIPASGSNLNWRRIAHLGSGDRAGGLSAFDEHAIHGVRTEILARNVCIRTGPKTGLRGSRLGRG